MIYIVDLDGVLAEFNASFAQQLGHPEIPVDDPNWPELWDWPQQYVSDEKLENVWERIRSSVNFWENLPGFHWTHEALTLLKDEALIGNDVYFVTARLGLEVKRQTERWLHRNGFRNPTVIVSPEGEKGGVVHDLNADVVIDDRPEVLIRAKISGKPTIRLYMQVHPYNKEFAFNAHKRHGILPVESPVTAIRSEYARREIYKEAV